MKYAVYLYRLVRVKVADVEAETLKDAMQKAELTAESQDLFRNMAVLHAGFESMNDEHVEWAESFTERACISPILKNGDEDYANTCVLDSVGEPIAYA